MGNLADLYKALKAVITLTDELSKATAEIKSLSRELRDTDRRIGGEMHVMERRLGDELAEIKSRLARLEGFIDGATRSASPPQRDLRPDGSTVLEDKRADREDDR
ncbi:MAG: hypothetical protein U1E53_15950 [Dongiaceae bacterium]